MSVLLRNLVAAVAVIGCLATIAEAKTEPGATLFGQSVTIEQISPAPAKLTKLVRDMGVSKDMAIASFQHNELARQILDAVMADYAKQHNITADPDLVARFIERFASQHAATTKNGATSSAGNDNSLPGIAQKQVLQWQIDKALYAELGGTVVFTQRNPQLPVEAYHTLLQQYAKAGKVNITDTRFSALFWKAFEPPYRFEIPAGQVSFAKPWWLTSQVVE